MRKLKRQTRQWKNYIKSSLHRPKLGVWADMCLAPVDTQVMLFSEEEGIYLGACIKLLKNSEYRWYRTEPDTDGLIRLINQCNPMWWMPLPLIPPERPA